MTDWMIPWMTQSMTEGVIQGMTEGVIEGIIPWVIQGVTEGVVPRIIPHIGQALCLVALRLFRHSLDDIRRVSSSFWTRCCFPSNIWRVSGVVSCSEA